MMKKFADTGCPADGQCEHCKVGANEFEWVLAQRLTTRVTTGAQITDFEPRPDDSVVGSRQLTICSTAYTRTKLRVQLDCVYNQRACDSFFMLVLMIWLFVAAFGGAPMRSA